MVGLRLIGTFACVLISIPACCGEHSVDTDHKTQSDTAPEYFRARHGYGGGLTQMVDLSKLQGFDAVRTFDGLPKFASKVPGAVGFTAHPDFEKGTRYAHAILWYTKLSSTGDSWALYLFDKTEAQKTPGEARRPAAVAAAEAKVSGKMKAAKDLIAAAGPSGVKLEGADYEEQKVLALAVMRQGGLFQHTGRFGVANCVGCRSVVPGGNPYSCGHGVQGKWHWNCCGATDEISHCQYWELIKAQDDSKQP